MRSAEAGGLPSWCSDCNWGAYIKIILSGYDKYTTCLSKKQSVRIAPTNIGKILFINISVLQYSGKNKQLTLYLVAF